MKEIPREKKITVRLTEKEFKEMEKRRGNTPKSEFLYLIILDYLKKERELDRKLKEILRKCQDKCESCKKIYSELGKIGNNINQIARHLNSRKKEKEYGKLVIETMELIQNLKMQSTEEKNGNIKEDS